MLRLKQTVPPEAAQAFAAGGAASYAADYSYDAWSLGMSLLHLYRGSGYYGSSATDSQIMQRVVQRDFTVDLSDVSDKQLRALLEGLLQRDPVKRLAALRKPNWYLRGSLFG
jgi:serine/threonine protein kinase